MKAKRLAKIVTKGGSREQNTTIGALLVNQYGGSLAFSRFNEETGKYEDAVGLVYANGDVVELGKFNNIHVCTDDPEVVGHFSNCLQKSQDFFVEKSSEEL